MRFFRTKKDPLLDPWDVAYFEHLSAELNALDSPATDPAANRARQLVAQFTEDRGKAKRSDLLELEQTLLGLQPTAVLLQRAPILRLRYQEAVGDRQFATYTPTADCEPGKGNDAQFRAALLADLTSLVSAIHWRYVLSPLREQVQTSLTKDVWRRIIWYTAAWAVLLIVFGWRLHAPFLLVLITVIYGGMLGGFISLLRRMQSVPEDGDSLFVTQALNDGNYFLWVSPLLGATFAVVLMLIFMSKLVGGELFPEFPKLPLTALSPGKDLDARTVWWFLQTLMPTDSFSYAKLLVWSFVAGFAEQFVPDILDTVIQRAQNTGTTPPPQAPPPRPHPDRGGDSGDGQHQDQNAVRARSL